MAHMGFRVFGRGLGLRVLNIGLRVYRVSRGETPKTQTLNPELQSEILSAVLAAQA